MPADRSIAISYRFTWGGCRFEEKLKVPNTSLCWGRVFHNKGRPIKKITFPNYISRWKNRSCAHKHFHSKIGRISFVCALQYDMHIINGCILCLMGSYYWHSCPDKRVPYKTLPDKIVLICKKVPEKTVPDKIVPGKILPKFYRFLLKWIINES